LEEIPSPLKILQAQSTYRLGSSAFRQNNRVMCWQYPLWNAANRPPLRREWQCQRELQAGRYRRRV